VVGMWEAMCSGFRTASGRCKDSDILEEDSSVEVRLLVESQGEILGETNTCLLKCSWIVEEFCDVTI
jgi:hypothetical protein